MQSVQLPCRFCLGSFRNSKDKKPGATLAEIRSIIQELLQTDFCKLPLFNLFEFRTILLQWRSFVTFSLFFFSNSHSRWSKKSNDSVDTVRRRSEVQILLGPAFFPKTATVGGLSWTNDPSTLPWRSISRVFALAVISRHCPKVKQITKEGMWWPQQLNWYSVRAVSQQFKAFNPG